MANKQITIRDPEGTDYFLEATDPNATEADAIAEAQRIARTPAGKVYRDFFALKQGDPNRGKSRLARSLEQGDNPYSGLTHDQMTAMMAGNAGGLVAGTAPLWGPGVGPVARYAAPAAVGAGLSHFDLPPWAHELVNDYILKAMLGRR